MPTSYYDIYYANGEHEQVYREEDMLACRHYRKVKKIVYRRYTDEGWKEKVIYE